jgi:hypothetical protein
MRQSEHFPLLEPSQQKPGFDTRLGSKRRRLDLAMEPDERLVRTLGHKRYVKYDIRGVAPQGARSCATMRATSRRGPLESREATGESDMVTVNYDDLSIAFDFVSSAGPMEHRAYVSVDTGAIYWISETNPIEEDELPDDLETSDRYIEIPHKNELDLGSRLALRFVEGRLPDRYAEVVTFFRHRGAYARLKELLAADGCLEEWYAFEAEAAERALREWCNANEIHLVESGGQPSA